MEPTTNASPRWFVSEVASMHLCFPSAGVMDPHTPSAWWRVLGGFPEWALRRAFVAAPKEAAQSQYLPSVESLRRCAEVALKTPPRVANYDLRQLPAAEHVDGRSLPESNPFMQLARKWEAESREWRLGPDDPTPYDIAMRRLAEIGELLGEKMAEKSL